MFGRKIAFLQVAVCGLLMSSHILTAKVDVKQSEQDLEIRNGKLALNIVKGDPGAVLSYQLDGNLQRAATLNVLQNDAPSATVRAFKLVQNTPELVVVEVEYAFTSGTAVTVAYTIKDNFEYVGAESDFAQGKAAISAAIKSKVLVLPDFLADHMVFYPESTPAETMNIPADNHLLVNLCDQGSAMLALLWDSSKMSISECKAGNLFEAVTLSSDAKARFWIGALAAKGLWFKGGEALDAGEFVELNWKPPFPAVWKMTTFLTKGFHTDKSTWESWRLVEKEPKESLLSWMRLEKGIALTMPSECQAFVSSLGRFTHPCYFLDGKAFVKKPFFPNMAKPPVFSDSPCLIYALSDNAKSLSGATMPKNALETILSKEMNASMEAMASPKDIYPATCGITAKVEKIFYRSESVQEANQIKSEFNRMNLFVLTMRERIEEYLCWSQKMQKILGEQKQINPQLNPFLDELESELAQINWAYAKAKPNMKTPSYCTTLTEKIIALIDGNLSDEEKEEQCKNVGRQIRIIGGTQDILLGVDRSIVKACRQYATTKLMASSHAAEKKLLEDFRHETGVILNNRLDMEGK